MVALLKMPMRLGADPVGLVDSVASGKGSERRLFPRKESRARVEGHRLDHTIPARRIPRLTLSLRDVSVGGLSGTTQTPLTVGERLAVAFPPEGLHAGWNAVGRVLRCEPGVFGYRVAVEFDPIPTAA